MSDAIVLEHVTKTFGPKVAVKDVSLRIPAGSVCGFIGPNGAGKTTTIRMIMSIIFPDSGRIEVLGRPSAVESKDRIGYLPEERGIYRKMRVAKFLAYMARLKGVDSRTIRPKVRDWLGRVGLEEAARKKCEELSKGMQQKVQFLAAVIHEPELLILDEVFSGLDPVNRVMMRELIQEQHDAGRTIVFSTHAMYEAEQLCDRIFMIHEGEKKLDLPLAEILSRYDPRKILVEPIESGGTAGAAVEAMRAVAGVLEAERTDDGIELRLGEGVEPATVMADVARRGGIRRVELKRANLEDTFIQVVGADAAAVLGRLNGSAPGSANAPAARAGGGGGSGGGAA